MNNTETNITIFTDGSSRGNPGPGGWGSVVVAGDHVTELGGGDKHTTNNRMELTACIEGISHTPKGSHILLNTDSSYVINGITKWIHGWKKNNWITKAKEDVLNKDLWMKLDACVADKKVEWKYVGGHIGILGNERCDHIATACADGRTISLYKGALSQYDLPDILNVSHNEADLKKKKSSSSKSNAKAYSYISMVGGVIETHKTWAECEKRVKGMKGTRYKKSISRENEENIIREFGAY
ncbi:MAG: ribonuclease HI [Patescibacteria group bacterium]